MPYETHTTPIEILLVQGDPTDVCMATAAFRSAKLRRHRHAVEGRECALAFLRPDGLLAHARRAP